MRSKKLWIVIGIIIFVIGGAFATFFITNQNRVSDDVEVNNQGDVGSDGVRTGSASATSGLNTASGLFTEDIAKEVLGKDATPSTNPITTQASTDDVSLTNRIFTTTANDALVAMVMVQGAKTDAGVKANTDSFEASRRQNLTGTNNADSTRVSGLGNDAYYNPDLRQVHVLAKDGRYWIVVQVTDDNFGNQSLSEKLARLIVEAL